MVRAHQPAQIDMQDNRFTVRPGADRTDRIISGEKFYFRDEPLELIARR